MLPHRLGGILLAKNPCKVLGTLFQLGAHRGFLLLTLTESIEVGLHSATRYRDLAPKDTCHPHLPLSTVMALEGATKMPLLCTRELWTVGYDKIKWQLIISPSFIGAEYRLVHNRADGYHATSR